MGNIGSHVDLTSWRRGHQAKPSWAAVFFHPPRDQAALHWPSLSGLLVLRGFRNSNRPLLNASASGLTDSPAQVSNTHDAAK